MTEEDVVAMMRDTFVVVLKLGAVPLLRMLAVGLLVSLVQSVTQISEQTLSFVPKLVALIAVLTLGEHYLFSALSAFTAETYDRMVAIGGS